MDTDPVLFPNIPVACRLYTLFEAMPHLLELAALTLDYNRTSLQPVRINGSKPPVVASHLQGFRWQGLNGNETKVAVNALTTSRQELIRKPSLLSDPRISARYFKLLAGKLLCQECALRARHDCEPLCLREWNKPDLLVFPIVRKPEVVRMEFTP